jgi:NAD(P)-dependent dehydrogenase (short-subunit alcohol dehydrogenase family)
MTLKDKTLFMSGGSRGIGLEIALRPARDGANVALIAKTAEPTPQLPGTVFTAAEESRRPASGRCRSSATSATSPRSRRPSPRRSSASAASTCASTTPRRSTCPAPRRWR